MAIKTQLDAILKKKMDRQDFIKHVAIGLVAMTGAGTALRLLAPKQQQQSVNMGYGGSAYGGMSDSHR